MFNCIKHKFMLITNFINNKHKVSMLFRANMSVKALTEPRQRQLTLSRLYELETYDF